VAMDRRGPRAALLGGRYMRVIAAYGDRGQGGQASGVFASGSGGMKGEGGPRATELKWVMSVQFA
jgi:hypothetical protein